MWKVPLNTEEVPLYTAKQVVLLSQNSSDTSRKSVTMSNALIICQLSCIVTLCAKIGTNNDGYSANHYHGIVPSS